MSLQPQVKILKLDCGTRALNFQRCYEKFEVSNKRLKLFLKILLACTVMPLESQLIFRSIYTQLMEFQNALKKVERS